MSTELARRFHYGTHDVDAFIPGTLTYQLTSGHVRREKQIVFLAKAQIAAQLTTAKAVERGSAVLANELRMQSEKLTRTIEHGFENLASSIYELQDVLQFELSAIRWELADQNSKLGEILSVLKRRRKTEAQELVEQGKLNLENEFFKESAERLTLALELDNTDVEAYITLGIANIELGKADEAVHAFEKAVAFSSRSPALLRAEAFLNLSRAYYCTSRWERAAECCAEIMSVAQDIPHSLEARSKYLHAVYSAKAGDLDTALRSLEQVILTDAEYLSIALSDKDWGDTQTEVLKLTEKVTADALRNAKSELADLRKALRESKAKESRYVTHIEARIAAAEDLLSVEPCYSKAVLATHQIRKTARIIQIADPLPALDAAAVALAADIQHLDQEVMRLESEQDHYTEEKNRMDGSRRRITVMWDCGLSVLGFGNLVFLGWIVDNVPTSGVFTLTIGVFLGIIFPLLLFYVILRQTQDRIDKLRDRKDLLAEVARMRRTKKDELKEASKKVRDVETNLQDAI